MKAMYLATALCAAVSLSSPSQAQVLPDQVKGKPAESEAVYSIELDYDAANKNLLVSYQTLELTSSICFYQSTDLSVSDETPSLAGPLPIGLVSFNTSRDPKGYCLMAFGNSGGNVTIEAFSGVPSALIIDGISYGFIRLTTDGNDVELVKEL